MSSNVSCAELGANTMLSTSPCVPHLDCIRSPCAPFVACPVLGPARWTSTMTHGVSVIIAYPIFSCMRLKPGPDVAVIDRAPPHEAPITADIAPISSSIWRYVPPTLGRFSAIISAISEAGVIG